MMYNNWVAKGVFFGLLMFVVISLVLPYHNEELIIGYNIFFGLLKWLAAGLILSFIILLIINKWGGSLDNNNVKLQIQLLKEVVLAENLKHWEKEMLIRHHIKKFKNDQDRFLKYLQLFISNHKSWLVKSIYNDNLENFFRFEFQACLDHLEEAHFLKLIEFAEMANTKSSGQNIAAKIVLEEAISFSYKIPNAQEVSQVNSHNYFSRKYNPSIKKVYEIRFPDSYNQISYPEERIWYKAAENEKQHTYEFGGRISGLEQEGINRVISLDPIPSELGITTVSKLTIGFNFEKAFWIPINITQPYYIQHNKEGEPIKELSTIPKESIEFYRENPIVPCKVILKETPKKYIHHPKSKNEWRLGGMPNWVQLAETVCCIKCEQPMKFILQVPSGYLKDANGDGIYYGSDGGTTYGFWCDTHQIMAYIWQDT